MTNTYPHSNLDKLINTESLHITIRALAAIIKEGELPYLTTGMFFFSLKDTDVAELDRMRSETETYLAGFMAGQIGVPSNALRNIITLCLLLATAEGRPDIDAKQLRLGILKLCEILKIEMEFRCSERNIPPNYCRYTLFETTERPCFASQFS